MRCSSYLSTNFTPRKVKLSPRPAVAAGWAPSVLGIENSGKWSIILQLLPSLCKMMGKMEQQKQTSLFRQKQ
jgi:hypothetical protein